MKKHSLVIQGHPTSVSLEDAFWEALKEIALTRQVSLTSLIADIDARRTTNLSSALRVFVLNEIQKKFLSNRKNEKPNSA